MPKIYNKYMIFKKTVSSKKGFTLVELVVTIAILAVLGTLVGFSATFFVRRAEEKAQQTSVETAFNSIQSVLVEINSGFSTYGSMRDAFQAVLDDSIRACEQYSNNEKYKMPSSSDAEGYYIVCKLVRSDVSSEETIGDQWSLSELYYVKKGNLWAYKDGAIKKL